MSIPDRVEKRITLKAPLARVWDAVSDSRKFGAWFGVRFDEPFAPGKAMVGRATPTQVHAETAANQAPFEGRPFTITVVAMDAPTRFSFRWHPFAFDERRDYTKEPTTLVEFVLSETPTGTLVVVTESGFDQVPLDRRAQAFGADEVCWEVGVQLLELYLEKFP